jgi:predicted nuclease of predicted toxin-antitoxin system
MHPLDYPILADENIHPQVVESLRRDGTEITSIAEQGLFGSSDSSILEKAAKAGQVVMTHDSDFGTLALMDANFIGILYLRPGHIRPEFTLETLKALRQKEINIQPPFIVVAERNRDKVKVRLRQL